MTLTELKYLITLEQERHFGRAADKCHVSQPTLSVAIKRLEEELGVIIFERNKNTLQLTPIGEKVVTQAQEVLNQASMVLEIAQEGKNQLNSPLRLGAIYTLGPYVLPHLIPLLQKETPDMPLYIEEGYTAVLRKKLRSGELDAILVALPFTEADVVTRHLYDEPFELLLPNNHPWVAEKTVSINKLPDEKLLLLGEGHCFRDQVFEACPALEKNLNNPKQTLIAEGGSLETIRHMVATGLGITVLPASAIGMSAYAPDLLVTRPFTSPAPKRSVALAWRASFPRPKAIDALIEAILAFKAQQTSS